MVEPRRMVTIPSVARSVSLLMVLSLLLALLLPAGLTLAQEGDDDADEAAATPAASSEDSPAGEYTVAITEDDVPQDHPNGADLIGRWQLFLEPDGSYSLGRADIGLVVTGSYTVDGETLTITDEEGLLSCVNAIPTAGTENPVETATYTWDLSNRGLTLTPILEGCQARGILFSTRPLDFFVACNTTAVVLSTGDVEDATPAATPETEDEGEEDADATPELDEDTIPIIDNPFGGGDDEDDDPDENVGSDENDRDASDISDEEAEDGIDSLLRQLSACWATQDPARIIPLFGADFLEALLDEAGSLQDVAGIFGQIMVVPINWERSGEVESDGETFSAIVALTIGGEETFQRYSFVFEDGQWLLDSFGF